MDNGETFHTPGLAEYCGNGCIIKQCTDTLHLPINNLMPCFTGYIKKPLYVIYYHTDHIKETESYSTTKEPN